MREGGQVTVAVTRRAPAAGPVFAGALDAHSVDLVAIDLGRLAVPGPRRRSGTGASYGAGRGRKAPKSTSGRVRQKQSTDT